MSSKFLRLVDHISLLNQTFLQSQVRVRSLQFFVRPLFSYLSLPKKITNPSGCLMTFPI